MTTRISLLSAALAIGTVAALPALAQTMTAPAPSASIESTAKTPANEHKAADKAAQDKKAHEQVAQHPGAAAKSDGAPKPDSTSK
jgi:hypothetical protein